MNINYKKGTSVCLNVALSGINSPHRYARVQRVKQELVEKEGGLANFAKGYEKFGLLKVTGGIQYREWAPGARELRLTGDFSM